MPVPALVHPRERVYRAAMIAVSLALYGLLVLWALRSPELRAGLILYGGLFALLSLLANGLLAGRIRGNAVRVTADQFPELHAKIVEYAAKLEMDAPPVYVMEAGGVLNAFAARFLRRHYVVLYAEVVALAKRAGENALGFVLAHELGHVYRPHLRQRWLLLPARLIPFMSQAHSRACEYTCDRIGAYCSPGGSVDGLLVLAVGRHLYGDVNAQRYVAAAAADGGFWVWFAEVLSSHPHLPHRINELSRTAPELVPLRNTASAGETAAARA